MKVNFLKKIWYFAEHIYIGHNELLQLVKLFGAKTGVMSWNM